MRARTYYNQWQLATSPGSGGGRKGFPPTQGYPCPKPLLNTPVPGRPAVTPAMRRAIRFLGTKELNFVSGIRQDGRGSPFDNFEPATWTRLSQARNSNASDVAQAVESASGACTTTSWSTTSGRERAKILRNAAQLIRRRVEEIAELETRDCGKPLWESKGDVEASADCIEYFAGLAPSVHGEHIHQLDGGGSFAYTRREPLGLCAGIGPWNYPFQTACWKVAPALACGNAFVYKPSPLAPLSAVLLAEIFVDAGLPPGIFNVVQGDGETGRLLASHEGVAKISFTGSVPTGKTVVNS